MTTAGFCGIVELVFETSQAFEKTERTAEDSLRFGATKCMQVQLQVVEGEMVAEALMDSLALRAQHCCGMELSLCVNHADML